MKNNTVPSDFKQNELKNLKGSTIEIDKNPLTFLRKNSKEGISIIKGMFGTILLFGTINMVLIIFSIFKYFTSNSNTVKFYDLLIALLICVSFGIIAYVKSYRNAINKAINIAYDKLNYLLQKFCNLVVEKVITIFKTKKENLNSENLNELISIQEILNKIFSKLPKFIVKGITMLLNKIDVIDLLLEFKDDIQQGNKEEASNKLFTKIDTQIKEALLADTSKTWVYWLLPVNIIIVLVFVFLKLT